MLDLFILQWFHLGSQNFLVRQGGFFFERPDTVKLLLQPDVGPGHGAG